MVSKVLGSQLLVLGFSFLTLLLYSENSTNKCVKIYLCGAIENSTRQYYIKGNMKRISIKNKSAWLLINCFLLFFTAVFFENTVADSIQKKR
jgi:hypothetical protein